MTAAVPRVPEGLRDLMKGFTKDILREKPNNIYDFSLNYFEALLEKSDDYTIKEYEQPISYENLYRVRDCNRVPVAIVFKIIPETLTELIKEFIKAVLRENPQNICEFGVNYFRSLQKTTAKNYDIQYTTYDNFIKNKEHLSLASYAKCTCGRPFLSEVKTEKTIIDVPEKHLGIKGSLKATSAENACFNHDAPIEETSVKAALNKNSSNKNKPTVNSQRDLNDEVYINAVYVIQKFFRNWIKAKQIASKGSSGESNRESFEISEEAAAVIIQRTFRKLFAKKFRQNLKPYPIIPILTNIQHHEEINDNVSEAASYTSASTVRMSTEPTAETMEMENSEYETVASGEKPVSQTTIVVDQQQSERVKEFGSDKQTETLIINLPTKDIQSKNGANNQPDNVNGSLIDTKDDSRKTSLHLENMETINREATVESLKMDSSITKYTLDLEEDFVNPRLANTSQTIHCDDSSQKDLFANMAKHKIEISKPIEKSDNVIGTCSGKSQELREYNTANELIIQDDEKAINIDTANRQDFPQTETIQPTNDEDIHDIKKRHIEYLNMAPLQAINYDEKNSENIESQIDSINSISTDAENNNNISSIEKLEKVKMFDSKSSTQLITNQEVVGSRDTLADIDVSTINYSEDQPTTENVSTEVQIMRTGNIPTETSRTTRNAEPLVELLNQFSQKNANQEEIDSLSTEKKDPELNRNSDQINYNDQSVTQIPTEQLEELPHQVSREVEDGDSNTGSSNQVNDKSSSKTEITSDSNKSKPPDEDFIHSESEIIINSKVSESLKNPLRQVSQEREQHEEVNADTSVKDDLREINNNDQIYKMDSNPTLHSKESNKLNTFSEEENGMEKINSSIIDEQDCTEVNNTKQINHKVSSQTQIPTKSNEVEAFDQISNESEEVERNGAVESEISAESTNTKQVNEILQKVSEKEHKNESVDGAVSAKKDGREINTDNQVSEKVNNQNKIFDELQDSTEIKNAEQICENAPNQTAIVPESKENIPREELLNQILHESKENGENGADATEISNTPSNKKPMDDLLHQESEAENNNAEHNLTQINNLTQNAVESTQTTALMHEVLQEENRIENKETINTGKQNSSEVKSVDQTSEQGPNNQENIVKSDEENPIKELLQLPVSQTVEEIEGIENNTLEAKRTSEIFEQEHHQETFVESKETIPENDTSAHVQDDLTEMKNFDQVSDTDSNQTKITVESSQKETDTKLSYITSEKDNAIHNKDYFITHKQNFSEVSNTSQINDKLSLSTEYDLTEINNVVQNSAQTQLCVESTKSGPEEDAVHKVSQEDDSKIVYQGAVKQDSKENQIASQIDGNGSNQTEIPVEFNTVKPLDELLHQFSQKVEDTDRKEIPSVEIKAKPDDKHLQIVSEKDKLGFVDATTPGKHDQTDINNINQIFKIDSEQTQATVQLNQATTPEDLSPKILQEANDINQKDCLSSNTEDLIKVNDIDQTSKESSNQSDTPTESKKASSLEEQFDQVTQGEKENIRSKAVGIVKDDQTDIRSIDQIEQIDLKRQSQIGAELNRTTPLKELLQQVSQDKEDTGTTVKGDLKKIHNCLRDFKDDNNNSKSHRNSSQTNERSEMQLISNEFTTTNITSEERMSDESNKLARGELEDGNVEISSIEELNDQESSHGKNHTNTNEMDTKAVITRKDIGFESLQNELQRTKRSINDAPIPEEESRQSEEQKEVIEEVFSKNINYLNNAFSSRNIPKQSISQSDENAADSEIHQEKDLVPNKDLSTNTGNNEANPMNLRNRETDMNYQIIDAGETNYFLQASAGMFETTNSKEVDTKHVNLGNILEKTYDLKQFSTFRKQDTSTASLNSQAIGTKNPFKNINWIDNSENSNSINNEFNSNIENVGNLKITSELALVKEHEQTVPGKDIKMFHIPNDTELHPCEMVDCMCLNENITNPGENLTLVDMNTEADGSSKNLDCGMLKQDDTKLKPRLDNERTATYMYGIHKARKISSQTSKTLRKTPTSYNIPLLENYTESLQSPSHTNQQSVSIESYVNTESKEDCKIASEETTITFSAFENTSETKETNKFSSPNKTNAATLEKLELNLDLDTYNNDVKNDSHLETISHKRVKESKDILKDLALDTEELNTHQLQSSTDDILHSDVYSEHSRTSSGILKTIIELNESKTPRKSKLKNTADKNPKTIDKDYSQMEKHDMIIVLNAAYDPLEFSGSSSDNDSEFTNSWTCSKETDENILSDEFINEIYNENEPSHVNKSKIIESDSALQGLQGGIYEMNPHENLPIDPTSTALSSKGNSNVIYEDQGENHLKKQIDIVKSNTHTEKSKIRENIDDYSAKNVNAQSEALESNVELCSDNLSKEASIHESSLRTTATDVGPVISPVFNSISYEEQSGILETPMEKIETYKNKHKNILIKKESGPEMKSSDDANENLSSDTNTSEHKMNFDNAPNLNEIKTEPTVTTMSQKEIDALITPSQSAAANEPQLVAKNETNSKNEFHQEEVNVDTEDINSSYVKDHSSDDQKDSDTTWISTNSKKKESEESASLLDKFAIVIQTAYRKYNLKKNIPVSTENKYGLSKSEVSTDSSNILINNYAEKSKSHFTEVTNVSNVKKLANIEESPPPYVEIIPPPYEAANISNEQSSSTIKEFPESYNKNHTIEWFVGDEPIVRSIPDPFTPPSINNDANALQQIVKDNSLADVASPHSKMNSPTASSEPATSPSINSIETIKVDSTSSLLEPDSISFSTNSKLKHSDGTVSAEEMNADNNLFKMKEERESSHETPVRSSSIKEENDEETPTNYKETPIENHSQEEIRSVNVMPPEKFTNDNEEDETVKKKFEGETSPQENSELSKEFNVQNRKETSPEVSGINSEATKTEWGILESSEALQLAAEFLSSRTSEYTNTLNSVTHFLDLEREYWASNIPYRCLEEPCVKKCVPLKDLENSSTFLESNNDGSILSDKSNVSEQDAADSLEVSTGKLRKTDEIIEKMQQKYAAESRVNSVDERLSVEVNFEEPIIRTMKELQGSRSSLADDDEIVVLKPLQREDTRESSEQSDSVIFGSEHNCKNGAETDPVKASLRRLYTIPGDDANVLFKTVTIDNTIKFIEPPESETTGTSDSNSFCLDEDTSENIRQRMMAYSLSEADSDFLGAETRDDSRSMDKSSMNRDDFNITTALKDLDGTSTETESTIVSAATKIQAGARGFLTRRRLRRASVGTKISLPDHNKTSFGNAAIDESLERLIEDEAAKKIQSAYRKHYRQGNNSLNAKKGHEDMSRCDESEGVVYKEAEVHTFSSFESALAARRHTLQRGDAMRNDSAPDEENIVSSDSDRTLKSFALTTKENNPIDKETSGAATADNGKKINNELKWIALRQNSMPVQIESEVFRVIPKHMRKRIKSAGGENKRRMRILKD